MRVAGVSGVYTITTPDGRTYVGSSIDVGTRWALHMRKFRLGENVQKLQAAWSAWGEAGLVFKLIEVVSLEDLDARERFWIDRLDSIASGYNTRRTTKRHMGRRVSDSTKEKLSSLMKGRPSPPKTSEGRASLSKHRKGKPQPLANVLALTESRRAKSKISQDLIDAIRKRYVPRCKINGASAIAREFGVSQPLVSMIVNGQRRTDK